MKPCFLNVDLEITSATKLDAVIREMGERVVVLYAGPAAEQTKHLLVLESSWQHRGPDTTIQALCLVIETLSPAARRIWNAAQKEFDVGYELPASERSSRFTLRHDTLERVAGLGATLAVTCYHGESVDGNK